MWPQLFLLLPLVSAALSNDTLLWGPYRSNLYFGLRPQIPQSLMTGFMWFGTQDYHSVSRTRHACDQGDNLDGYDWTEYDARQGGVQVLKDSANNVKITTEFIKIQGGDHGGSWAARIKGEPMTNDKPCRVSTVFYVGLEGLGGLDMETDEDENGITDEFRLSGSTPELDNFTVRIVDTADNQHLADGSFAAAFRKTTGRTHYLGRAVSSGNMWQAKDVIMGPLVDHARELVAPYTNPSAGPPDPSYTLQLPNEVMMGSNLFAVQKTFDGPFQFDVYYDNASNKQKLDVSTIDSRIQDLKEAYDKRFKTIFPYPQDFPQDQRQNIDAFSKAMTSSIVAGVGYFYGTSIVDRKFSFEWDESDDEHNQGDDGDARGPRLTDPKSLVTGTPSRSFFPRGFYWDEGFHLLHIGQWDNDFSLEILKSWIDLVDEDGWVAREQILGEEARSKVPAEFQTQIPNYANPPTLTMAVTAFIDRLKAHSAARGPTDADLGLDFGLDAGPQSYFALGTDIKAESRYLEDPVLAMSFLKSIYEPLKRHFEWFRRTQRGQIKQYGRTARSRTEGYRWRGRSESHVLTSGMDDYPRGPPHAGELHLDLISWMGFFSRTMHDIADFIGEADDAAAYHDIEQAILANIEDLHWNEDMQMYCDLSVNDDDESYHVCHKGYLSIFPLFLSLLKPDSPHLGHILDLIRDPHHLWSPYGLRSLSASHHEFGQGENYWKGPIWIQMNFLALRALHKTYVAQEGPYQTKAREIYTELRKNVVNNVLKEYNRTGYVWEQYDAMTGEGRRRQSPLYRLDFVDGNDYCGKVLSNRMHLFVELQDIEYIILYTSMSMFAILYPSEIRSLVSLSAFQDIMSGILTQDFFLSSMYGHSPHSAIIAAILFAFGVLCFFTALFVILCRSGKHSTDQANHIQQDTESCMDQRNGGRPASMYNDQKLGHELPQNSSRGHHRLPPLCSRAASQETVESITPTASQPVIYGNEDQECKVRVTVTPPTPAKEGS